ncbi:MarR family winged helix-turn-helix transcriptional regulator [Streptomyces botrytidirepellens]|uniref:MarR family transcriptional regulator n=1 Tax=Streptomyces botrytidirepellens TaxID=2486417 RepID=A0A3M8SAI5_9ACTN|nr:MarR family transcriptional regulator [Streptomyces botrytidirepellens]RNF78169.1 MarR family transcriptional regulator [Streptomyces botrytidirepellens]
MGARKRTAAEAARGPLVHEFGLLLKAATHLEQRINAAMRAESGISHVMFEVLIRLCKDPEEQVSQRALAQDLILTSGGVTRLIDRMEEAGLVRRVPSPDDRRVTLVEATAEGEQTFVHAVDVHARIVERYYVAPVTAADRDRLTASLERITTALLADSGGTEDSSP